MTNIRGLMGKGVPPTPKSFSMLRISILALSLAVLVSCAYNLSLLGGNTGSYAGPPGFMLFVTLLTLLVLGGAMALERFAPHLYFRLAILIAYGVNALFWLSGWAWTASIAATFLENTCIGSTCFGPTTGEKRYGGSMAAAATLGAVNWVMMVVVLFYFIKGCLADPDCYGLSTGQGAEMGNLKTEEGKSLAGTSGSE